VFQFIERWRQQRRADRALVKVVDAMKAEQHLMIEAIAQQYALKLAQMTPEERARAIARLRQ
jgi:hypothetical protein